MEALAAVGVASAAVQFLDFAVKTLALCREIRDSSDGFTKTNDDLLTSVRRMKAWQTELQPKCVATLGAARRLNEAVRACSSIANELLQLLEHIREVAKKPLGALRSALRTLKEGKRIEKLQTRLSDCQARFHLALTAEMRDSLLRSLEAQGKNSESVRAIILQKLDFTYDCLRLLDENVTQSAIATQEQMSRLSADQQSSRININRGQQDLDCKMTSHFSALATSSTHQEFFDSLFFKEMFARQENMKGCSPGTYDWVFSGKLPSHSDPSEIYFKREEERLERRGRIARWLCGAHEQPVFWVNGKPGSGKSSLMSYINDAVFCMIDGLDECEDRPSDLLNEVLQINFGPCAKMCLSSRPEQAISQRLQRIPSTSLQELNYGDIFEYARTKVGLSDDQTRDLAHDVAEEAEGVFLWAVLVCDSLCSGIVAEDDTATLLQRLRNYPKGLDELFARMFASIDELHFKSLAFYFYAARQDFFSIALAVASQHLQDITSLKQFLDMCRREATRVRTQSRGLLEVNLSEDLLTCTHGWSLRDISDKRLREWRLEDDDARLLSRYMHTGIDFVHRSAYDYIFKDVDDRLPERVRLMDTRQISSKVFDGILWLAEYGLILEKRGDNYFYQWQFLLHFENGIDAQDLLAIHEEHALNGFRRVFGVLTSWETLQMKSTWSDFRAALAEGGEPRAEIERDHWRLFGEFWRTALLIKPEFVSSNLPLLYDRDDTYFNVIHLMATWARRMYHPGMNFHMRHMHPAMHSAMYSAIANIRLPSHNDYSIMEFPSDTKQRRHLYSFDDFAAPGEDGDDYPYQFISWYGAADLSYERMIIYELRHIVAYLDDNSQKVSMIEADNEYTAHEKLLETTISKTLYAVLETWQLFEGSCMTVSGKPLPLQLSLPMILRTSSAASLDPNGADNDHTLSEIPTVRLHIACFANHGENNLVRLAQTGQPFSSTATYQLSPAITTDLMKFGTTDLGGLPTTHFVGSPAEQFRCTEMVMAELWDDQELQLTAWEQLYLRACVKSYFVHFWKENESEWH